MWVFFFFFEQKQTERVAGICSPYSLHGLPHSGRKWLPEVLGPHFPSCSGAVFSAHSLPYPAVLRAR